ncbi:unnamed protein product [Penicillium egyptiacum]|uniref:Serine hydrolase domain-containing protein n=1 Tax=Penicillium egyptiacum TaxID=1303716 RepID=A0A9W4KJ47_9EURO|nr:unnamed protein product [Penicillium egyptiacum]
MRQYMEQTVLKTLQQDRTRQISSMEFYYPSGQLRADPENWNKDDDTRAWGHGDPETEHIQGLEESVQYVSDILERHGPFTGIMGFSTGAALASIVTSLLEKRRSICNFNMTRDHPSMEFAICMSGFQLAHPEYAPIYYPKIKTPILHVMGCLDPMIDPSRSLRLAKKCVNTEIYQFWGTHYVPRTRDFLKVFGRFVEGILIGRDDENDWESYE